MVNVNAHINKRIRERRIALDIKQDELAMKTQLCQSYISEIESNKKVPSLKTVTKIALALDCSVTDLIQDNHIEKKTKK